MYSPLIAIGIFYMAGIAVNSLLKIAPLTSVIILSSFSALTLISFFFGKRFFSLMIVLDIFFIGIAFSGFHYNPISKENIKYFDAQGNAPVLVGGIVATEPQRKNKKASFLLRVDSVKNDRYVNSLESRAEGLVKVTCRADTFDFTYGDRILVKGKLYKPSSFSKKSSFNYRGYLLNKGIFLLLSGREITLARKGAADPFSRYAFACRTWMRSAIDRFLPGEEGKLLRGVVLGDRAGISQELQDKFVNTGLAHTLVVSGQNVGLVSVIFYFFFVKIVRLKKKIGALFTVPFIIFYTVMTGAEPPVMRSMIMSVAVVAGLFFQRDTDLLSNLSLAALLILLVNPLSLFDASFQLSFLATAGIIYLVPFFEKSFVRVMPEWIAAPLAVSVAAQIGVAPLLAYYFNNISIVALIANIFILPVMGVILTLGIIAPVVSLISMPAAGIVSFVNYIFLRYFISAIDFFNTFPFASIKVLSPPSVFIAGYYAGLVSPQFKYGKYVFMGLWVLLGVYVWVQVFSL